MKKIEKDLLSMEENNKAGWEAGYQDAIDEAAEWLKDFSTEHNIMSFVDSHMLETDELVRIFKNVMEEKSITENK